MTEAAFDKIDKALDEAALINAAAICKSDMAQCVLEFAREFHRAFVKAGYNFDKSLAAVCKTQGHAIAMQRTYWRDVYGYFANAAQYPKAASTLIQEGVFTQHIVDQCRIVTK